MSRLKPGFDLVLVVDGCYVLNFSALSFHTSIMSTVWGTESGRLDEVCINSVTSELRVHPKRSKGQAAIVQRLVVLSNPSAFSARIRRGRWFQKEKAQGQET